MTSLELRAKDLLLGSHRAAAAELGVGKAVEEVAPCTGDEVVPGRVVLTELEALKAVERDRLGDARRTTELMEKQAVTAEAGGVSENRRRGDAVLAGDLAKAGASEELVEDAGEQIGPAEPVGDLEGLSAEVTSTVDTAVTLDAVGWA
jgi:hypothetical protein